MIFVVELEKHMVNTSIFDIIIGKLRYGKKLGLIILLKVDKGLEVDFDCTILPLGLAIHLWIKGNRKFLLDVKEII